MSYKFETNAPTFEIIYEKENTKWGYYPHTGITPLAGICIMFKTLKNDMWLNLDYHAYDSPLAIDMSDFVDKDEIYEVMIYSPILSNLSKLQIEIPAGFTASKTSWNSSRNIVVAGGSISYGLGCNTVNSMFSNVLERNFNAEVKHITYNSTNYMEKINDYYKNNNPSVSDVIILELDNYSQKESMIEEQLPEVISILKNKCRYLIGWYAIPPKKAFKKIIANNIIKEDIYNKTLEVLDMSFIFDEDYMEMCDYNNWFINDAANIMIYNKLEECIRRLTKWNI